VAKYRETMCHMKQFPYLRERGKKVVGFGLLLALGCLPWAGALAGPPTVQELVDQFSMANYCNVVSNKLYTRKGMNRAPVQVGGAQHDLCRDAIYDEFQQVGLNPYKDPFSYVDTMGPTTVHVCNIIAVKEGVQNPNNEVYVLGAHYDSRENPGADDNATGVGCALEIARIFAQHHFAKTIVFAIFDSEERTEAVTGRHRLGSLRYVGQHLNDNIKGMISVDMIGWQAPSPNHNKAYICGRPAFNTIRYELQAALTNYGGLNGVISTSDNMSDHYSFEQAGFSACCLIEYNWSGNSRYHTANDYVEAPGYLDWDYLEKMCKGTIGYFATQLQPVDVTPQVLSVQFDAGGCIIHGQGLALCQYAIDRCTDLITPDWVAIGTNTAAAVDGTFAVLDTDANPNSQPAGFYRARFVSGYTGGPGNLPQIIVQPLHRVVDTGGATSFSVSAIGDPPLNYQWRLNGNAIAGATNNTCVILDAQAAAAGDYSVVVANYSGSVTSKVVSLTVYPPQTQVFADDFDSDTSANWTLSQSSTDTRCTFNYDYSADGIPSAPNSVGGTTRGVKFEANMTKGITAALSMSPVGLSVGGDYRLCFDMWINANGPFPLGGNGSSEYITGGLGTTGGHVQWDRAGSAADGYWFAVNGEGQAVDTSVISDYGAYARTNVQTAASGVYAAGTNNNSRGNLNGYYVTAFPGQAPPLLQQATYPQQTGVLEDGAVGFAWREVIIAKRGNIVEWSIDGVKLAAFTSASVVASNIFVGYWDPFVSISDNAALSFGLVDNVRVEWATNSTPPTDVIIIDNPAATVTGQWTNGVMSTDKYGDDYFYTYAGTGTQYVEYRPNLPASGNYAVYEWHPEGTNRTADAPIAIKYHGGSQTVRINQKINGGQWNLLGTFNFAAGTAGYVRIQDNFTTGTVVMADAIKFVYAP